MRRAALLLGPAAALLLAACAGAPPAAPPPAPVGAATAAPPAAPAPGPAPEAVATVAPGAAAAPPFAALAARFQEQALRQEKAGEPRRALESWRVVAALRPGAAEPKRRVDELAARLAAESARRYAAGMARLGEGDVEAARRELLLALAADPGNADALDALKNRLEPEAATHTVAAGETLEQIAERYYGEAAKAPIVARLNALDPAARPPAGAVLLVPSLAPTAARVHPAATPALPAAEPAGMREGGGETEPAAIDGEGAPAPPTAAPAEQVPAAPTPAAPPAVPPAAPAPPRSDRAEAQRRREKAEEAYTAGVRFFINQQLDAAIRSWELTLSLNPEHPKAAKDIEKARALQQKLRDIR